MKLKINNYIEEMIKKTDSLFELNKTVKLKNILSEKQLEKVLERLEEFDCVQYSESKRCVRELYYFRKHNDNDNGEIFDVNEELHDEYHEELQRYIYDIEDDIERFWMGYFYEYIYLEELLNLNFTEFFRKELFSIEDIFNIQKNIFDSAKKYVYKQTDEEAFNRIKKIYDKNFVLNNKNFKELFDVSELILIEQGVEMMQEWANYRYLKYDCQYEEKLSNGKVGFLESSQILLNMLKQYIDDAKKFVSEMDDVFQRFGSAYYLESVLNTSFLYPRFEDFCNYSYFDFDTYDEINFDIYKKAIDYVWRFAKNYVK